jgi:8-oxo-dGTP diphosphatase
MSEDKKDYPRPSLTADVVVMALADPVAGEGGAPGGAVPEAGPPSRLRVLFVRRAHAPFAGAWALPGGFVDPDETVGEAAVRELSEETSLRGVRVEEIGCFSRPGRDPRGWVVTIAHLALVPRGRLGEVKAGDDAAAAEWLDLTVEPGGRYRLSHRGSPVDTLAFDHADILGRALQHLARGGPALYAELRSARA